jgi:hypothetical protein
MQGIFHKKKKSWITKNIELQLYSYIYFIKGCIKFNQMTEEGDICVFFPLNFLHAYLWVGAYMLLTKENIDNIFKYIIIFNKARVTVEML